MRDLVKEFAFWVVVGHGLGIAIILILKIWEIVLDSALFMFNLNKEFILFVLDKRKGK